MTKTLNAALPQMPRKVRQHSEAYQHGFNREGSDYCFNGEDNIAKCEVLFGTAAVAIATEVATVRKIVDAVICLGSSKNYEEKMYHFGPAANADEN